MDVQRAHAQGKLTVPEAGVRGRFFTFILWTLSLGLLCSLLAAAYYVHGLTREWRAAESAGDTVQVPKRAANGVVKLGKELAESHGIQDEPAQSHVWQERLTIYGRVVPNSRAVTEVRASFAGMVKAVPGGKWPLPGTRVHAGQVFGWLDVRFGPQERLDLQAKLADARAKQNGADEVIKVQQARIDRLKSAGQSVSRSELDAALTQIADAQTQLAMAKAGVQQWQDALTAIDSHKEKNSVAWSQPLTAPADGEVTELAARPGMAVEAGGLIARLVDFRQVLLRLDFPVAALSAGPPEQVELLTVMPPPPSLEGPTNRPDSAASARPVIARMVGAAPQVEAAAQLAGFWYEVEPGASAQVSTWRPGLFVRTFVRTADAVKRNAVTVADGALLYHQGRALVYVRLSPGRFERREVQVLGRENGRWVLATGVTAGEPVVSRNAQVLLSEEFRGDADND